MGEHSAVFQAWIDSIMASRLVDKVCILRWDYAGVEASTPGFNLDQKSINEVIEIVREVDDPSKGFWFQAAQRTPENKYQKIRSDPELILGRNKETQESIIIGRPHNCVIIATTGKDQQPRAASSIIEGVVQKMNGQ